MVGIDWISVVIFVVAYAVSQMGRLSLRLRYLVWTVAYVLVALFRLRYGLQGTNGVLTGVVVVLAVFHGYKAMRAPGR